MTSKTGVSSRAADGSLFVTLTDGSGTLGGGSVRDIPVGATQIAASSGNVAAATATATLSGAANVTTYITGFTINGSGATAASVVNATVSNIIGSVTLTYPIAVVAGVTLGNQMINVQFSPALPASATNTSIAVSCPTLGAGNTNNCVNAFGYRL